MTKINEDDKKYLRESFESERAESEILELKRELIRDDLKNSLTGFINAKNDITRRNRDHKSELEQLLQKNY